MMASFSGNEAMVDYCLDHHCNVDQESSVSKIALYDPWYTLHWTLTNTNIYSMVRQAYIMQLYLAD